ncbi:hypothetical protein [Streptomyces cadmiisoli]|uniref:hypothetical protein n=1 Tax=Streptomyces cadmiisoli TaxID=2184053 RepID=UPI001FE7F200|nr:hypothetical protein [Streptomyces cadmiisoli]
MTGSMPACASQVSYSVARLRRRSRSRPSSLIRPGRIKELGRERERRRKRATEYDTWLAQAGMDPVTDAASFRERTDQISTARSRAEEQEQQARGKLDNLAIARHGNTTATDALRREITSLQQQRSSIPAQLLALRRELATATGVSD